MGEFKSFVEKFSRMLKERINDSGIYADEIPEIIDRSFNRNEINCYPGSPSNECFDFVLFIALQASPYAKGKGHLSFEKAIEKIVQHLQGYCAGKARNAVFITDSWDPKVFEKWRSNLKQIIRTVTLFEIYLLSGDSISEIRI